MTEIPVPQPLPEQLKEDWQRRVQPIEREVPQPDNFSPVKWLGGFYDYYYSERNPVLVDSDLIRIANDVFGMVTTPETARAIAEVQAATSSPVLADDKEGAQGKKLQQLKVRLGEGMHRLSGRIKFEKLLKQLETKTQTATEIKAQVNDIKAKESLDVCALRAEKLGQPEQELIENIRMIHSTRENLQDDLIQNQIDAGDSEIEAVFNRFHEVRTQLDRAFSVNPQAFRETLLSNHDFLMSLNLDSGLRLTMNNLQILTRATPRQLTALRNSLNNLLSDSNRRDFVTLQLVNSGRVDRNVLETLDAMVGINTCLLRTMQLEQNIPETTTSEQRQAVYATSLADLINEGVSPSLIEDIVNGKVNSENLVVYNMLNWLSNNQESLARLVKDGGNPALEKILELIKTGASLAVLPLAALAAVVPKLPLPLPSFLKIPSTSLESSLSGLFEGMQFQNRQTLWEISGFHLSFTNQEAYFREFSSSTFDITKGTWVEDLKTTELGKPMVNQALLGNPTEGQISTKLPFRRKGFAYFPVPYGYSARHIKVDRGGYIYNADKRNDGSVGFDFDTGNTSKSTATDKKKILFIKSPHSQLLEQFPFDTRAGLVPIIVEPERTLPQDVRAFLHDLDARGLTKAQEAEAIVAFVHDNSTYSLDPKNKGIYERALKEGPESFIRTFYTRRYYKCDGAATAAIGLMRLRGIPARLTTGLLKGDGEEKLGAQTKHGWVEYVVNGELKIGDPTPEEMDEYTQKMMNRSSFVERLFGRFNFKIIIQHELIDLESINADVLRRVFRKINPGQRLDWSDRPYRCNYMAKGKAKFKEKARLISDRAKLLRMEQDIETSPMTTSDLTTRLNRERIISEREVRISMVAKNFLDITQPVFVDFYESIFGFETIPHEGDFRDKPGEGPYKCKSRTEADKYWQSKTEVFRKLLVASLINKDGSVRFSEVRNPDGSFSNKYINTLVTLLRSAMYNDIHIPSNKTQRALRIQAIARHKEKYCCLITENAVKQSYIPELTASYWQTLNDIRQN